MNTRKTTHRKADELDVALQNAAYGRPIRMLDLPRLRPEAEKRIATGASITEAAEAAVQMYQLATRA